MDEDRYQQELFEFEKPKKAAPRFSKIFPRVDFEGRTAITLTLEKLVFIVIGIVMCMVLIYAFGVENGKSRVSAAAKPPAAPVTKAQSQARAPQAMPPAVVAQKTGVAIPPKSFSSTAQVAPEKAPLLPQKAQVAPVAAAPIVSQSSLAKDPSKPYTIVAAAFSKKEAAQSEAAAIARKGFSTYIAYSDPYYLVCTGAYASKDGSETKRDLTRVRRLVAKDAYIKLR